MPVLWGFFLKRSAESCWNAVENV